MTLNELLDLRSGVINVNGRQRVPNFDHPIKIYEVDIVNRGKGKYTFKLGVRRRSSRGCDKLDIVINVKVIMGVL